MNLLERARETLFRPRPDRGESELRELRETIRQQQWALELLQEATAEAELELARDSIGWERLSWTGNREMPRDILQKALERSRLMFLKDPLINRSVLVQADYVFAQGLTIAARDENVNAVVQTFWDDPANQVELTSQLALWLKECDLQVYGNLFLVFFVDAASGQVRVRSIPPDEIQEVICNPEDSREPWYYRRVWSQVDLAGGVRSQIAYYPDWRKPANVTYQPRDGGQVLDYPLHHIRVGGLSDMRFGVPETYQALDWARAYVRFLEDRATVARALSRFVFKLETPGGKTGVAAAKSKLGTTLGLSSAETNPPPVAGSTFIAAAGSGANLEPIRTAGATIHPDEGRAFKLMVMAARGIPETFAGDVSVGTLATATSLDRPTELKFLMRRQLWQSELQSILQFVIDQAVKVGQLADGVDRHVDIDAPSLLEHDPEKRIGALIDAATLRGQSWVGTLDPQTFLSLLLDALEVDDKDEVMERVLPYFEAMLGQGAQGQQQEAFVEALRDLRQAVAKVLEG